MLKQATSIFSPGQIGNLQISNRFIASAISYRDADQYGFPSDSELDHVRRLARGRVGLIIPGYMYTSKNGRTRLWQDGMSSTCHAESWRSVIDNVHELGSKIVFQIAHGGLAAPSEMIKAVPKGPSPVLPNTQQLTMSEIEYIIQSYVKAAKRLMDIGADGIELHCGHGFLLSQFLSPLINRRVDDYGGSVLNRAKIIVEIVNEIKRIRNRDDFIIMAKINGDDALKKGGITPEICAQTVNILDRAGVDMFEITSGLISPWNIVRGKKSESFVDFDHPHFTNFFKSHFLDTEFKEGYNVEYLKIIKRMNPNVMFSVVGGHRQLDEMEKLVSSGVTDFISLGRPLLKDPFLVDKFYNGKIKESDCDNCNICYMNPPYMSVHCPKSKVIPYI